MVKSIIILFVVVLHGFAVQSQVDFSASVQTNGREVTTDDKIILKIKYNAKGDFTPPAFKDFNAQGGGENVMSSISIINGKRSDSYSISRNYYLQAKRPGKLVIESAALVVDGKTYRTQPITIEVSKGNAPQVAAGAFDPNAKLIAKVYPSKTAVYQGEPFTMVYKVYTPYKFRQIRDVNFPSYTGFNKHSLLSKNIKQYDVATENVNGKSYQVLTLERELLLPSSAGTFQLDPYDVEMVLTDSWGWNTAVVDAKSNSVTITVKALPENSKPDNFSGAVGNFDISATASKDFLGEDDDGFDLQIEISGKGNTDFDNPNIKLPKQFDSYPPESEAESTPSSSGMSVSKTYNYFTVPLANGDFILGPFEFSYFDPVSGTYRTASTDEISIKVDNPNIKAKRLSDDENKLALESGVKDLRYIKSDTHLSEKGRYLFGTSKFWIALGTPALAFFVLLFIKRRKKEEDLEAELNRAIAKAGKLATSRLKQAKNHLDSGDKDAFYIENIRALYSYVSTKIGMQAADMNKQSIRSELEARSVSDATVTKLISSLEKCEMARYGAISGNPEDVYQDSIQLITTIESEIK